MKLNFEDRDAHKLKSYGAFNLKHILQIVRVLLQECILQIPLYNIIMRHCISAIWAICCNIDNGGDRHCNIPQISGQYAQIARENAKLQKLFT